tara:strand:- start:3 stop:314 length:312 start_codon:yes stop_codon:yes gene_type:complete
MSDSVKAIAYNTKQFTIADPLSNDESLALITLAQKKKLNVTVNSAGRIILFEADDLLPCTEILSELGLIEDICFIREITDWEVSGFHQEELQIEINFDNDEGK